MNQQIPTWAPRVDAQKIKNLYELNAQGIIDEELLDDVGYGLLARAYSFKTTLKAHHEDVATCPMCHTEIPIINKGKKDLIECSCGWSLAWGKYHESYKGKQLTGMSVIPMVDEFIRNFEAQINNPAGKMRVIDNLLHRFHWEIQNNPTRPVAVNFIDLTTHNAVKFIIELGFSENDFFAKEQFESWLTNAKKSGYYDELIE